MNKKVITAEMAEKMQEVLKDESIIKKCAAAEGPAEMQKIWADHGLGEISVEDMEYFIKGLKGEALTSEELDEADMDNVAGGGLLAGVALGAGAGLAGYAACVAVGAGAFYVMYQLGRAATRNDPSCRR